MRCFPICSSLRPTQPALGDFDDSPLKGAQLVFETNPYIPGELRLGYKLLKDAGYLPPEMELRKQICTLEEGRGIKGRRDPR